MSDYNLQIAWSGKDALADSDPDKVVSGGDFNTDFKDWSRYSAPL